MIVKKYCIFRPGAPCKVIEVNALRHIYFEHFRMFIISICRLDTCRLHVYNLRVIEID